MRSMIYKKLTIIVNNININKQCNVCCLREFENWLEKRMNQHNPILFASLPGCQANLFSADEPKPQLEQLTDAFWSYAAKATRTAEETLKMIRESQLGQDVK